MKLSNTKQTFTKLAGAFFIVAFASACSPEVGSEKWCENMKEKPKGDWTAEQAKDFAKHCIL